MNNLNPLYEGGFETAAAIGVAAAGTGIPQRLIGAAAGKIQQARAARRARMMARIQARTGGVQDQQEEEPQESPYVQMQRMNRGIIHQNAFPYDN